MPWFFLQLVLYGLAIVLALVGTVIHHTWLAFAGLIVGVIMLGLDYLRDHRHESAWSTDPETGMRLRVTPGGDIHYHTVDVLQRYLAQSRANRHPTARQ